MKLFKPRERPIFEIEVWPFKDRVVGHCLCGRCGERFSVTLRANPNALPKLLENEEFIRLRLINFANAKHGCDSEAWPKDPAETNRIVNKWHEYKLWAKKFLGDDNEKSAA